MAGVKGRSGSGGKRIGSGQPRKGDRVVLSTRISIEASAKLKEISSLCDKPIGEVIESMIMKTKIKVNKL